MVIPMDTSAKVIERAMTNGGSITAAEAEALGASRAWLSRRVRDGWIERISSGSYVLRGSETRWKATLAAACHKLGAVVSHESAAELHGLPGLRTGLLVVSVPIRHTNRYPDVVVHQKTDLTPIQISQVDGLPTTTPARTLIDLAADLGPKRLGRLVDNAVASQLVSYQSLSSLFELLARRGKPGVRVMRTVLTDRGSSAQPPESVLESLLLELIQDAGLPEPARQFQAPWLTPTRGRVDLAYENHRLVIEADSRRWHMMADAFLEDRERDNLAQLAGWRVLRFTFWDIQERPGYVVTIIRKALS